MVNTNKLKGLLRERGITQADLAKFLELSQPAVNQKINNVRPMTLDEAEKLSTMLEIDAGEFGVYFFASRVAFCNYLDVKRG